MKSLTEAGETSEEPASKGAPPPRQASGRQEKSARTAPEVTIARVLAPAKLVKDLSDEIQAASVRYTLRAARGAAGILIEY